MGHEQIIKFWWRSRSPSGYWEVGWLVGCSLASLFSTNMAISETNYWEVLIRQMVALVRRTLAEVCTVWCLYSFTIVASGQWPPKGLSCCCVNINISSVDLWNVNDRTSEKGVFRSYSL